MQIGYARVSTDEQTLNLQLDALAAAGCDRLCTDTASGAKADRPGLREALDHLRAGDTLVVWRLDRLGRSLRHLIETVTTLAQRGVGFKSLTESIDTTSPGGKLIFHIFGALAEFERDLIRERTRAGLTAARARGRKGGHPRVKSLTDPKQLAVAKRLYAAKDTTVDEMSSSSFHRGPRALRHPQVRPDNLTLVPASLLPRKADDEAIADQLPRGEVLLVLPSADSPERTTLAARRPLVSGQGPPRHHPHRGTPPACREPMTAPRFHNIAVDSPSPLSTLGPALVETFAGFQASVRFASTDPAQNRLRFYDDHAQSAIRQLV